MTTRMHQPLRGPRSDGRSSPPLTIRSTSRPSATSAIASNQAIRGRLVRGPLSAVRRPCDRLHIENAALVDIPPRIANEDDAFACPECVAGHAHALHSDGSPPLAAVET